MADTPPPPNYVTMTGHQFRREVGTDPDKWAAAFVACNVSAKGPAAIADWFADAMVASAVAVDWTEDIGSYSRHDPRRQH